MGATFLVLLAVAAQSPPPDSAAFTTPAVRQLVERAAARRRATDSAVTDYRARIRYRLSFGFGRRRWARIPPAVVEEQVARVHWQAPNDLRVDVLGRRIRARSRDLEPSSVFDRPWFVPRGVGDSVRIFSNDFPATGALHPLSAAGPAWYRYTLAGGVRVRTPSGQSLRLLRVDVVPRRSGPALVAGRLWIDSASAEVVRMTVRYVGTGLWIRVGAPRAPDSASARRINALANRVVSVDADVEYALQEGRHWMPYRQVISGRVRLPILGNGVIPFQAVTTFEDYEINTGRPIVFELPLGADSVARRERAARRDSLRAARRGAGEEADGLRSWDYAGRWPGGRYELHRPSDDSLARYAGWEDSLPPAEPPAGDAERRATEAELEALAEELPDDLTGRAQGGIGYERLADLLQYNRVQGLSFGLGYRVDLPGLRFTSTYATVRYGLSDERVTGRLTVLRDAPGGRLALGGYRDIADLDPFSPGRTFGNALNAIFAAHDDADYALALGGRATYEASLGSGLDLVAAAGVERLESVSRRARSAVNDFLGGSGLFPPNPAVAAGTYGDAAVRLVGFGATRWSVTVDGLAGEGRAVGRLYGDLRRDLGGRRGATLRLKAGVATEPTLPQSLFRLGGIQTVRGFGYGHRRAPAFWAAQLDVSPLGGRIRPVLFLDAGQAARPADLFGSRALVGGGVGVSILRGLLRFDLSVPLTPEAGGKVRFDLVLLGVR